MAKQYSLAELAEATQCELRGDPHALIDNVADLDSATPREVSFLSNPRYTASRYIQAMKKSQAGAIFVEPSAELPEGRNYLLSDNASKAFQRAVELFHPPRQNSSGFVGIHPTSVVHPTAKIGTNVTIGPHAVVDENVEIGNNTFLGANSYIGPDTTIGEDCLIHPRVVVREKCRIGNRVILQPGAIIGSCGFGYLTDERGRHTKLTQVGDVRIEDDVEIGANTTIDRARFKSTVVGKGTKIDNLVQLGHGAVLGPHNILVAQTGIAGSTSTGKYVVLAGQCAVAGHLHLADGVMVSGKSGVTKSLSTGKYGGIPAVPIAEYNRQHVLLRNIETYVDKIKNLEMRLAALESKNS